MRFCIKTQVASPLTSLKTNKMNAKSIPCPHCQTNAKATKSRKLSSALKEITYLCQNSDCRHMFVASLNILRTLTFTLTVPCATNPDVQIELSRYVSSCAVGEI